MTINSIYRNYLSQLETIYSREEATAISDIIFEFETGKRKSDIIINPLFELEERVLLNLSTYLVDLLQHKPVQYITGTVRFNKLNFKVSPAVLIPRPETEELVLLAIQESNKIKSKKILDIGTGSGCIAISVKKTRSDAMVTAIDKSNDALAIAMQNAELNKTEIHFKKIDFLDRKQWTGLDCYDLILSNPPYIPESEKSLMDLNVTRFEPETALFVDTNRPLIFYEKIADFAMEHLTENGKIIVEIHEGFAKETALAFEVCGFDTEIMNDFFGKPRIVKANRRAR